jgi:hypothetical protein
MRMLFPDEGSRKLRSRLDSVEDRIVTLGIVVLDN